jgi:uncharacterized protein involved in response to NO
MEGWLLAAIANGVVSLAYVSISFHILRGVQRAGAVHDNRLGTATGLIFATCAAGHLGHPGHRLDPSTRAASVAVYDWHLIWIDAITAGIAIRYWLLRKRLPALVHGVALFDDLSQRRHQALAIHDRVVQELATAKLAVELGEVAQGLAALERGLESAREIVTSLVDDDMLSTAVMESGGLRRESPA